MNNTAQFLVTDYACLQERVKTFEEIKAARVNFFLLIFGAIGAGISAAMQVPVVKDNAQTIILASSIVLFLLGVATLHHSVNYSEAIVTLFRRSGRIRRWFLEENSKIAPFLVFEAADNKPRYDIDFGNLIWRGAEPAVIIVNSVLLTVAVVMIFLIQVPTIFPGIFIVNLLILTVLVLIFSYLQLLFVKKRMQKRQKKQDKPAEDADVIQGVIFPYDKNAHRNLVSQYLKAKDHD